MKNEVNPSQVLLEVARGYSIFTVNNKDYYFKHFSIEEMLELDEFESNQIDLAKKSGIKSQDQLIKDALKYGSWTQQEEDKIKSSQWMIDKSSTALKKISDPMQRKSFNSQIEKQRKDLDILKDKKNKICSYSAETLGQQKRLSKMILKSLFYDKAFKKEIKKEEMDFLGGLIFSKFAELADKENLLRASYSTYFFEVFMSSQSCVDLFGARFMNLTIFQKNLISYSRGLLNKLKNVKIPEEFASDPVKMFDYEEEEEKEENTTHGVEDIKRKMKARGGELKAEDFLG